MSSRVPFKSTTKATLHPFSAQAGAGQVHLRIMETTDLHMHVYPYDYYRDRAADTIGLARTATHISNTRAEAANSLLLDNGDFLQGNPMGDYAYECGMKEGDTHPIIDAMNAVGFDGTTLGNHDFNYGLEFLMKSLATAAFPVISANVAKKAAGPPTKDITLVQPYVILDRIVTDGAGNSLAIKIGLIGFVPPQIMSWDRRNLEGNVTARDILQTARAYVPEMREAGADIVVALSHSGIGAANETDGMENASVPLAAVDGIDALLTGHSHLVFPSPTFTDYPAVNAVDGLIHGKPATMGGFWGSHLGVIDLMLESEAGEWRVVNSNSETRPISTRNEDQSITALVESDPTVLETTATAHKATLDYVHRPVGMSTAPLHSYFALVTADPHLQIVSNAQNWYIGQMLEGSPFDELPILSAAAPFKAGGRGGPENYIDIPAGDLTLRNMADLYIYPNTICAVKVTGRELRDWLERSTGLYNQVIPGGANQSLINGEFPSYNFDVIDGVSYQIDLSEPSKFNVKGVLANPTANRIKALKFKDEEVTDQMEFIIATNSFRAGGGGSFPGADGSSLVFDATEMNRDIIVRYIARQGKITPRAVETWRFSPMKDTSVLFETGPKASRYVNDPMHVDITPEGDSADGFALFRLSL